MSDPIEPDETEFPASPSKQSPPLPPPPPVPSFPPSSRSLVAVIPDAVAILGFVLLAYFRVLTGEGAAGFILAVLAGRLYPRSPHSSGGSPPSGLLSIAYPAVILHSWIHGSFVRLFSRSHGVQTHDYTRS